MKLYHGSNTRIDSIDLRECRPHKDFGQGFYLTDLLHQAQRMAVKTSRIYSGAPVVNVFEFDIEEARKQGLKIKFFDKPDKEWAYFVMKNRNINEPTPCHDFDIVIGPVADDKISRLLRLFTENLISEDNLLKELTFSDITSQFFFHTEKAVSFLKKVKYLHYDG